MNSAGVLTSAEPVALVEDTLGGGRSRVFWDAEQVLTCTAPDGLPDALAQVGEAPARGVHAVGWISYETGYVLEPALRPLLGPAPAIPLLCFALFRRVAEIGTSDVDAAARAVGGPAAARPEAVRLNTSREQYAAALARVLQHIAAGDTYQVNFTMKYLFELAGHPLAWYGALRQRQPTEYTTYLRVPGTSVLSLSPELFFSATPDGRITCRPMKGTAPRGADPADDERLAAWLATDPKSRAENVMIVDMIRNDLTRICEPATIEVARLLEVERYRTVLQMTSTVRGQLRPGTTFSDVIRGLFPCASVTGAPKVSTMRLIRQLETAPRGVYTGALGHLGPGEGMRFSVPIRTAVVDERGAGELGVGSGVLADSRPDDEYAECLLKGQFALGSVEQPGPGFGG